MERKGRIVVIAGPTAAGKTEVAIRVARRVSGDIVSCDSMQIYKYMDIGSAKPTPEERALATHYLVDEIDPSDEFSVAKYQTLAKEYISKILSQGRVPIVEGGTGLYLNSLLYDMDFPGEGKDKKFRDDLTEEARLFGNMFVYEKLKAIDPEAAERIHPNNLIRVIKALEAASTGSSMGDFNKFSRTEDYDTIMFGVTRDRSELYDRINRRVDIMVDAGLFDEVKGLLERGISEDDISMKGIGYKEVLAYFDGVYTYEETLDKIKQNTRHLAKRQEAWFKRYQDMIWYNLSQITIDEAVEQIVWQIEQK
ncbi:MAG: tRNA (adenosine(37)-N6)-dimethylallyltransferase MiaA [Clostridia bacterium]|nr:tRNA (adenosine(37)-N6)-dimethylallyltransferase MiaA [Clostridia bacterium]